MVARAACGRGVRPARAMGWHRRCPQLRTERPRLGLRRVQCPAKDRRRLRYAQETCSRMQCHRWRSLGTTPAISLRLVTARRTVHARALAVVCIRFRASNFRLSTMGTTKKQIRTGLRDSRRLRWRGRENRVGRQVMGMRRLADKVQRPCKCKGLATDRQAVCIAPRICRRSTEIDRQARQIYRMDSEPRHSNGWVTDSPRSRICQHRTNSIHIWFQEARATRPVLATW